MTCVLWQTDSTNKQSQELCHTPISSDAAGFLFDNKYCHIWDSNVILVQASQVADVPQPADYYHLSS
jgi:hypothetical protein